MWKSLLSTLGLPLGGLTGVAIVRGWCVHGQTRFREEDLIHNYFTPLSVAIVVAAIAGAFIGATVGLLLGRRLDKQRYAGEPRSRRIHGRTAIGVATLGIIAGLGLATYAFRFASRTASVAGRSALQFEEIIHLQVRLAADPDQADSVAAELLGIATDARTNARIQRLALASLKEIGPAQKAAVPVLVEGLKNSSFNVRWHCSEALGRIGADARPAVPQLTRALQDSELTLRRSAANTLWLIERNADLILPALVETLVIQAERGDRWEFAKLTGIIEEIGPEAGDAVPALIALLPQNEERAKGGWLAKDIDRDIRARAAFTLGAIGPNAKEAIPALTIAQNDPSELIAKAATQALAKIQSEAEAARKNE